MLTIKSIPRILSFVNTYIALSCYDNPIYIRTSYIANHARLSYMQPIIESIYTSINGLESVIRLAYDRGLAYTLEIISTKRCP